jgi:hypothetical protein
VGKLLEQPETMPQVETLEELEENMKDPIDSKKDSPGIE